MKTAHELSGPWKLNHCEPFQGEMNGFHAAADTAGWLDAAVPGDAHLDLLAAGRIPDPFFALNAEHCIWMEDKDWWYRTSFEAPQTSSGQSVFLLFEGLDTLATVYLNGEVIGRHANMFTPLRIEVTRALKPGANTLAVSLASVNYAPQIKPHPDVVGFGHRRCYLRKSQSCFGWDVLPRLVTVGIWRPVRLLVCDRVEITDVNIQTLAIENGAARVEATVELTRHHAQEPDAAPLELRLRLAEQERTVLVSAEEAVTQVRQVFEFPQADLWWPLGHGKPALHEYEISVSQGGALDRRAGTFGIRTVEMVQEPLAEGRTSFYFKVNGKPVFLKGMNWTPFDALYPRMDEAGYRRLIDTARDGHINTLRVWGGAVYESDLFYDLCDRAGILVWQDFMFACAIYPQDDGFITQVRAEAECVVRRLRSHPSLLVWSGDNEVDWTYNLRKDLDHRKSRISREALPAAVAALDPLRPYVPSCPFSPVSTDPNCHDEGDVHLWYHGTSYRDDRYLKVRPRMITEIGHLALPAMEVIRAFIPEGECWPPESPAWRLHASDPLRLGWGEGRIRSLYESIKNAGMEPPQNLCDLIARTQQLQADASRCWIEHCAADEECWGIILWNLCDGWPQISDAYIAYPFHPKPALEAVKQAFAQITR